MDVLRRKYIGAVVWSDTIHQKVNHRRGELLFARVNNSGSGTFCKLLNVDLKIQREISEVIMLT